LLGIIDINGLDNMKTSIIIKKKKDNLTIDMKTISQYAKEKGITRQAVLKRIKKKKLKAVKVGSVWIIN
jgi:hypothetical protein